MPPTSGSPAERPDWSRYTYKWRPWRQRVTPFEMIAEATYPGDGTPENPFIVTWLEKDAENPRTYSTSFKISNLSLLAVMCFCITFASSTYTAVEEQVTAEFNCSKEVFFVGLSLMLVGFAVGPILFAPLSEAFGRRNVVLITLAIHTIWAGLCSSAQSIQSLLVFRLFSGIFGAPALVVPAGQLADIFEVCYIEVVSQGLLNLGPIVGGFLGQAAGWRWVMGFLAIFAGVLCVLGTIFVPETYAPILLRKRAQLLSKVTGKTYMIALDVERPESFQAMLKRSMIRPWALLLREPIVLLLSLYMAVVYAFLNLNFAAYPIVYEQTYGWDASTRGVAFLGILTGISLGIVALYFDNKRYIRIHNANGGFAPPETRLHTVVIGGVIAIIGLAWFAAAAGSNVHYIVPILSGVPFGLGFILIFQACFNYLVDSYVIYTASVTAANIVLRATLAAAFPLFTPIMYRNLGIHWASAVPAFLAVACFPFPIFFLRYGERIRKRCKYSAEAARHLELLKRKSEQQQMQAQTTPPVNEEMSIEKGLGEERRLPVSSKDDKEARRSIEEHPRGVHPG